MMTLAWNDDGPCSTGSKIFLLEQASNHLLQCMGNGIVCLYLCIHFSSPSCTVNYFQQNIFAFCAGSLLVFKWRDESDGEGYHALSLNQPTKHEHVFKRKMRSVRQADRVPWVVIMHGSFSILSLLTNYALQCTIINERAKLSLQRIPLLL